MTEKDNNWILLHPKLLEADSAEKEEEEVDDILEFEMMTDDQLMEWVDSACEEAQNMSEEEKNRMSERFFDLHMLFAPDTSEEEDLEEIIEALTPDAEELLRKTEVMIDCLTGEFQNNQMTEQACIRLADHVSRLFGGKDDA